MAIIIEWLHDDDDDDDMVNNGITIPYYNGNVDADDDIDYDEDRYDDGVVEWCEGVVYLTSQGYPTDIGLQLGKACYPCSR